MANLRWFLLLLLVITPILISSFIYQLDTFDAAPLPNDHDYFSKTSIPVPKRHNHVLSVSERVGEGLLFGPEDFAYDASKSLLFTGCEDGWLKTVSVRDDDEDYLKVENWTFVGGRPLGVALAHDGSVVVAEPDQGEKKGTIEFFIQNLPGFPDNIRYDREGHYWIGLRSGRTLLWDLILGYPFIRKLLVTLEKNYVRIPNGMENGGVLSVDLDGQPVSLYSDKGLYYYVTGGLKVGKNLYQGSLRKPYLNRIDLNKHAAQAKYE